MKLSQLGEFALIERIARHFKVKSKDVVVGIGDDCAVLRTAGSYQLATTDTLIENIHFKLKNISFFDLGRKALAVNISDIAAMGGWPTFALVTVGLPRNLEVKAVAEIYRGIKALAKKYAIEIVGGDTVQSPKEIVVSITLLGEVEKERFLTRSGAKVGNLILAAGVFGRPGTPIRLKEAQLIAKSHLATAMIDSSDGLVRSVVELCKASKVGAEIWQNKIPIAKGATLEEALYGGEEYELVFTAPQKNASRLARLIEKRTKTKVSLIGKITKQNQKIKLISPRGKVIALKKFGFEHFLNVY